MRPARQHQNSAEPHNIHTTLAPPKSILILIHHRLYTQAS